MKTRKLVSGIISIVLSVFGVFQSMMAGLANALEESGQVSGSAGLVVSICMLCGGIVSIVSRKNNSKRNQHCTYYSVWFSYIHRLCTCRKLLRPIYLVSMVFNQRSTCLHLIKKRYQKLKLIPF